MSESTHSSPPQTIRRWRFLRLCVRQACCDAATCANDPQGCKERSRSPSAGHGQNCCWTSPTLSSSPQKLRRFVISKRNFITPKFLSASCHRHGQAEFRPVWAGRSWSITCWAPPRTRGAGVAHRHDHLSSGAQLTCRVCVMGSWTVRGSSDGLSPAYPLRCNLKSNSSEWSC